MCVCVCLYVYLVLKCLTEVDLLIILHETNVSVIRVKNDICDLDLDLVTTSKKWAKSSNVHCNEAIFDECIGLHISGQYAADKLK